MKNLTLSFCLALVATLISFDTTAQSRGFTDRFDDSSFELERRPQYPNAPKPAPFIIWSTFSPGTYDMRETDGVMKINYSKTKGTGAFDMITWKPPFPINVYGNPNVQVKIKASVATKLTIRPTYSFQPPTYEELSQDIPGDNEWHTYTFKLYDYLYNKFSVQTVGFYFDQGSSKATKGVIEMDDARIGWYLIRAFDLSADIVDGTSVRLSWNTNNPENAGSFKIYRGTEPRFVVSESNFIGESTTNSYLDEKLGDYKLYYYKVVPLGKGGEVFLPSEDLRAETHKVGTEPSITVANANTATLKKYEKFELTLDLDNVGVHNPYDPEDVDLYADFKSPQGKTVRINGFYDDFGGADDWKVRFSTSEIGEWSYQVFVNDAGRVAETSIGTFEVIESSHHGWIKPSVKNPHYLTHDDGTSYYALGVYSPWRNTQERFDTFAEHNANLFAIWDIGYGGFVNETGVIEEELGKYNQEKLGRIDSLLVILENKDIKLMYALWPHDLFSASVWATEWDKNPYNQFTNAVDVYASELAWEYQKKKYRYMIARFAHSRSMGIWELVNEMNGTDGWKEMRHEAALDWVEKADKYFEENDPYNHPVTASFSGGFREYRKPLYERNDIPNIHIYPAQGWQMKYPEDTLRSAMHNYAWASQRFWNDFEKPALFGEAGADLAYFNNNDPRYHETYHNTLWATLSNGLAGVPVWWQYRHLSEQDWDQLNVVSDFVSDIDFANETYQPTTVNAEGADAYGMTSTANGFGWVRSFDRMDISATDLSMHIEEGKYDIKWFDTWTGEMMKADNGTAENGILKVTVPKLSEARKDIAFKVIKID